jgi:hypothetical protein
LAGKVQARSRARGRCLSQGRCVGYLGAVRSGLEHELSTRVAVSSDEILGLASGRPLPE